MKTKGGGSSPNGPQKKKARKKTDKKSPVPKRLGFDKSEESDCALQREANPNMDVPQENRRQKKQRAPTVKDSRSPQPPTVSKSEELGGTKVVTAPSETEVKYLVASSSSAGDGASKTKPKNKPKKEVECSSIKPPAAKKQRKDDGAKSSASKRVFSGDDSDDVKPPPRKKKKTKSEAEEKMSLVEEKKSSVEDGTPDKAEVEATDFDPFPALEVKTEGGNRLDASPRNDLLGIVIDEVSLEGLDGITVEALWTRIADATSETLPLKKHMQTLIWNIVRNVDRIRFYELPEPRPKLVVFNRYKHFDWESGHVIEPDEYPADIYPFFPISDKLVNIPTAFTASVLGSCAAYETRKDVTDEAKKMSLEEADSKFGSKLVIVADQALRTKALISENADPTIKLSNVQYCILERIGRSRRLGEVTAGQNSLMHFGDSKTLFYLRKQLVKNNFITKQPFCIRNKQAGNSIGLLFHLRRFYSEHKSKKQVLIEQVVDILKKKPKHRIEYVELKKIVGLDTWSKGGLQKLLKTPDFKQFVNTDVTVPYRTMYPNALPKEWKLKSSPKEKGLRILELINPSVNVSAVFRGDDQKDESSDDEPIGEYPFNASIFNHTYNLIFEAGSDGLSLKQVQRKLGLEFYLTRSILNNMVKRNIVDTVNVDIGRQHIIKYYARCFNNKEFCDKFNKDKERVVPSEAVQVSCDEEVLDFIADVLKVNKECLKPENAVDPSQDRPEKVTNPFAGSYEVVKKFRRINRLEKYNMTEKNRYKAENLSQMALKDDDVMVVDEEVVAQDRPDNKDLRDAREKYEAVLKNLHPYYTMELSVQENRIERLSQTVAPNLTFAEICKAIAHEKPKDDFKQTPKLKIEVKESRLNLDPIKSTVSRSVVPRLRGSTEKATSIVRDYFFRDVTISYLTLVMKFKGLLDEIRSKVESKSLQVPSDLQSDDECYNDDESRDDWSVVINAGDSMLPLQQGKFLAEREVEDFKRVLIEDFEKPNFLVRKEILEESVACVADDVAETPVCEGKLKVADGERKPSQQQSFVRMNAFMGSEPEVASQTTDEDGIETIVIISTAPERYAEIGAKYENKQMSERSLARANFIIDTVCREKMITDLTKLTAMLKAVEKRSRCSGTIDKKTLDRLLQKLVVEGYLKMVKIVLKYDSIVRIKNMICLPPVDVNTVVQSTIEQMKMNFFIYAKRKSIENLTSKGGEDNRVGNEGQGKTLTPDADEANGKSSGESLNEMTSLLTGSNKPCKYRYSRIIGKQYGYVPKFAKIKLMHEVMFYLIYGYDGEAVSKDDLPKLLRQLNGKLDATNVSDLSTVYKRELSWKMFVPPLPKHRSWPEGWALVCDILLRLPLSIFVKIYNVSYVIPELVPFLSDPIKRHYLIKNVPPNIRDGFLSNRKYIYSIHEILCHLCYVGLLQFGAQKLRDKDQQFVYLNINAVLYDTVTSDPGYHQVSKRNYPKLTFTFAREADVEEYWSKMWSISMSTKLGQRYSQLQKTITLQDIHGKKLMVDAMLPKSQQMAAEADVGYIPGDRLGACCLDSSTWVHIKRNWVWTSHVRKGHRAEVPPGNFVTGARKKHLEQVRVKPIKFRDLQKEIAKKKLVAKRESEGSPQCEGKRIAAKRKVVSKRKLPIFRKVLPRPPVKRKKRAIVDEVDTKIMSKMGKSRSIWSDEEDVSLILCRSSANYLCPNNKAKMVPHTTIRDVMHRLCPNKRKKPSTAYNRRYLKMIKSEDLEGKQKFMYTLDNDSVIQKYFGKFRDKLRTENTITDDQLCVAFVYLASYAMDHYKRSYKSQQKQMQESGYIDYLTPQDVYKFDRSMDLRDADVLYREPCGEDDLKIDLIKSVIHCSLGWKPDNPELPLKLYRIYLNFPDSLLRSAIMCLREQQVIAGKKTQTKHLNVKEVINVGGSLIHSSFTYSFKQITKYPDYVYPEAYEFFTGIHRHKESREQFFIENFEQGHGLGLSEMATKRKPDFAFKVPDEFLVLDPNIADHSELFQELAIRYKFMLSKRHAGDNEQASNEQLEEMIERAFETYNFKTRSCAENKEPEGLSDITGAVIRSDCNVKEEAMRDKTAGDGEGRNVDDDQKGGNVDVDHEGGGVDEDRKGENVDEDQEGWNMDDDQEGGNVDEDKKGGNVEEDQKGENADVDQGDGNVDEDPKGGNVNEDQERGNVDEDQKGGNVDEDQDGESVDEDQEGGNAEEDQEGQNQRMIGISDLAYLLTKGLFPERDDEERLENLHKHFLLMFPSSSFAIPGFDDGDDWYHDILRGYPSKNCKLMRRIETECVLASCPPEEYEILLALRKSGANVADTNTAKAIVAFTYERSRFGATAQELKTNFPNAGGNLDLHAIVSILLGKCALIRAGVCSFRFVHFDHNDAWTVQLDEQRTASEDGERFRVGVGVRLKVMPWMEISGIVNVKILHNWLGIVLSHCMSYPRVTVVALTKRFNFLKPVDIFALLEYLQELSCVELYAYERSDSVTLFSDFTYVEKRKACMLDAFDDVFVETDTMAATKFGAFLNGDKADIATLFDVP